MQGKNDCEHTHVVDAGFGDGAILDVCGEVPTKVAASVTRFKYDAT